MTLRCHQSKSLMDGFSPMIKGVPPWFSLHGFPSLAFLIIKGHHFQMIQILMSFDHWIKTISPNGFSIFPIVFVFSLHGQFPVITITSFSPKESSPGCRAPRFSVPGRCLRTLKARNWSMMLIYCFFFLCLCLCFVLVFVDLVFGYFEVLKLPLHHIKYHEWQF